jgi:hypothetical protein
MYLSENGNRAFDSVSKCLYHLNGTRNSRVSGHGIRIVLYALVRLVTVVVLLSVLRNQGVGAPASAVIIYRCSDYTVKVFTLPIKPYNPPH